MREPPRLMPRYWVQANSADVARTLVALNVAAAIDARDETLFDCIQDDTRKPPAGLICSDTEGPIAIKVSASEMNLSFYRFLFR
jgi:hypothetical protein